MSSRLLLPIALRRYADGKTEMEIHGETLAAALDDVAARHPTLERRLRDEQGVLRPHVLVFVDGVGVRGSAGLGTRLNDGAEVFIAPAVSGG